MNMAGAEFFLGSHPLDGVHVVELDQGPVFSNFSDARSAISRTCGPEVAALFAEPILSRGNGEAPARLDWYTGLDGKISAIDEVDPGTAAIVREKLAFTPECPAGIGDRSRGWVRDLGGPQCLLSIIDFARRR